MDWYRFGDHASDNKKNMGESGRGRKCLRRNIHHHYMNNRREQVKKSISALLVEDNVDDEYLSIRTLNKVGLNTVAVARDGLEAIKMLQGDVNSGIEATCRPDVIFLDLRLPKIDGVDVLRRIRAGEGTKFIKVIVLTSAEDPRSKQACHDLAVAAYLSKPLQENDVERLGLL
jgi:CheY-like chemotaxis protein